MPINIISWDNEHVLAEYIDRQGTAHAIQEVLGDIDDYEDAYLTALDEADRMGLINSGQKLALTRHFLNPPNKEFMAKIGQKGLKKRWKKPRK
jgi:hypothetical protein